MRAFLLALLAGLVLVAAPTAAQEAGDLDPTLRSIAALWAGGDADALARRVASRGLELEVDGQVMELIASRQAAAALRHLFSGEETVSVVPTRTAQVQGAEDRAFGELTWRHLTRGSVSADTTTVFVGLVREGPRWRISQIRILP